MTIIGRVSATKHRLRAYLIRRFPLAYEIIFTPGKYRIYCETFEPSFWTICGKFSVIATVLSALIFHLLGCYRTDLVNEIGQTTRTLFLGFAWVLAIGLATAFLSKSMNDVSRVWTVPAALVRTSPGLLV
jgi:hypothetical protein